MWGCDLFTVVISRRLKRVLLRTACTSATTTAKKKKKKMMMNENLEMNDNKKKKMMMMKKRKKNKSIIHRRMNNCWRSLWSIEPARDDCVAEKNKHSSIPRYFSTSDMADDLNAVRKFLAIKHSWRGSYNRIFKLGSCISNT